MNDHRSSIRNLSSSKSLHPKSRKTTFKRNTTTFGSKSPVSHWFIHTTNGKPELSILTASMHIKTATRTSTFCKHFNQ